MLRGGSWYDTAQYARSAYRFGFEPGYRNNVIGFRCALVQEAGREASEQAAGESRRGTSPTDQSE